MRPCYEGTIKSENRRDCLNKEQQRPKKKKNLKDLDLSLRKLTGETLKHCLLNICLICLETIYPHDSL